MPGKIDDPPAMRVTCSKGHYLGSLVNLVTGRAVFCEQCHAWISWEDLNIGRQRRENKKEKED